MEQTYTGFLCDKLCLHKDDEITGIRTLMDFNTAVLGKQFWRLIGKPDSLFVRVLKGRKEIFYNIEYSYHLSF